MGVRHLLPGEKMVSAIQVLAAVAVVVNGQPAGDKPLDECCDMKTVGGVTYTLTGQMNTKMYNCLNDCVYQMEGRPEAKFCFAMGDQQVECNDDEMVGSERPPMEGSERPPMEGSERPPVEGSERPPVEEGSSPAPGSAGSRSYLAGISYSFDSSNSPFCAGSLISSEWILTTASCSYSDSTKTAVDKVKIVLGEETLGTPDEENFKVVSVSQIIVHPSYSQSSSTGQSNLALWKLSEPVSTSVYSTVCLPAQGTEQAGGATLVGWRISLLVGSLSQTLTQTDTQLVSGTECGVSETIICTEADTTGCQGDLGGP